FLLEMTILGVYTRHLGVHLLPKWRGSRQNVKPVFAQYLPIVVGTSSMSISFLVDQIMAASLGSGAVAALNYGNRMVGGFLAVGSVALGTTFLPHFAGLVAASDWVNVRRTFSRYTKLILGIFTLFAITVAIGSETIIRLTLERGAFTNEDVHLVSLIQIGYVLQMPPYLLLIMYSRLLTSLQLNKVLMVIGVLNLVMSVTFNYIFMQILGVVGIALSTSLMQWLAFIGIF